MYICKDYISALSVCLPVCLTVHTTLLGLGLDGASLGIGHLFQLQAFRDLGISALA